MIYLGIDPGQSGGIAAISCQRADGGVFRAFAWAMPETETEVWERIQEVRSPHTFAIIERVHAMPKQGVSSAFTFGRSYGFLRGCLIAAEIPFEEVEPGRWQLGFVPRKAKAPKPSDETPEALKLAAAAASKLKREHKTSLLGKAQQLFPGLKLTKKTCDALLLAEYLRRTRSVRL